jgi:hypothetical protein
MISIETWQRDDCTLGVLTCGDFKCFTLELPWRDNERNVSCIPRAEGYKGVKFLSNKNGSAIKIINVMNRDHIQIHKGNYTSQIEGCILVGDSIKFLNEDGIPDVTNSKKTMNKLLELLPNHFDISIK